MFGIHDPEINHWANIISPYGTDSLRCFSLSQCHSTYVFAQWRSGESFRKLASEPAFQYDDVLYGLDRLQPANGNSHVRVMWLFCWQCSSILYILYQSWIWSIALSSMRFYRLDAFIFWSSHFAQRYYERRDLGSIDIGKEYEGDKAAKPTLYCFSLFAEEVIREAQMGKWNVVCLTNKRRWCLQKRWRLWERIGVSVDVLALIREKVLQNKHD